MREEFINLLEKYEDQIMESTLGSLKDEDGHRFAELYKHEWRDHKLCVSYVVCSILKSENKVTPEGLAYIIISEWSGVMIFEKQRIKFDLLISVCKQILNEFMGEIDYE